jgi:hypothetical protein
MLALVLEEEVPVAGFTYGDHDRTVAPAGSVQGGLCQSRN